MHPANTASRWRRRSLRIQKYTIHIDAICRRKTPANDKGKDIIAISFMPRLNIARFWTRARTVATSAIRNNMGLKVASEFKKRAPKKRAETAIDGLLFAS